MAEMWGDREIVMEAVKQNGFALQFASAELEGDREIVMEAVKQDGHALYCASAELQGDREIVMEAVACDMEAFRWASSELRKGGLKAYLDDLVEKRFTIPKYTFIATVLFGAKSPPRSSFCVAAVGGIVEVASRQAWHLCDVVAMNSTHTTIRRRSDVKTIDVPHRETRTAPPPPPQPPPQQHGSNDGCCFLSLLRPSERLPSSLSTVIKRLIWDFAGVRGGPRWKVIKAVADRAYQHKQFNPIVTVSPPFNRRRP